MGLAHWMNHPPGYSCKIRIIINLIAEHCQDVNAEQRFGENDFKNTKLNQLWRIMRSKFLISPLQTFDLTYVYHFNSPNPVNGIR